MSSASGERFQKAHEKLQNIEQCFTKLATDRETLIAQFNENKLVKNELAKMGEDSTIYKRTGSVLATTSVEEARSDVNSRIERIETSLDSVQEKITNTEQELKAQREAVLAARQEFDKEKARREARSQ
ncbi:Prefoldin subunit [Carpediemonas membranifera]|uniref:Prefoldin subunit n=1 Tax=Carpediemonas membranifera TaxID=201153 RepID=A0A8J6B895_9EUKA|nr:Prefoldin subunit [Carpediemonas membranifera]|eukprot:KAG9396304.1 Prefoldin subunit [Carpediemonas membranifera]